MGDAHESPVPVSCEEFAVNSSRFARPSTTLQVALAVAMNERAVRCVRVSFS